MKQRLRLAVLGLLLACGTDPEPVNEGPETIGQIPDQEVYPAERFQVNLTAFFHDPEGDALKYTASIADPDLFTIGIAAASLTGIANRKRGATTVTATATDPQGESASLDFMATVLNRAPTVRASIPDVELYVDSSTSVDLSNHFTDPDMDTLVYEAASDNSVVDIDLQDAMLTLTAADTGVAKITITATDEGDDTISSSFSTSVVVYEPPSSGFREDFNDNSALNNWEEKRLRARVIDSMVVLDSEELADDLIAPHIYREVEIEGHWRADWSMARHQGEGVASTVQVFTNDDKVLAWSVNVDYQYHELTLFYLWQNNNGQREWEELYYDDDLGIDDVDEQIEYSLSVIGNVVTLVMDGTELYSEDLEDGLRGNRSPPPGAVGVGPGFYFAYTNADGVTFDWIKIGSDSSSFVWPKKKKSTNDRVRKSPGKGKRK